MSKLKTIRADILVVTVILIVGIKFTSGLDKALDIWLWDETYYLQNGATMATVGMPPAEWGPLYSVWYYGLSLIEPSPIGLYYLNLQLMILLPAAFLYILLIRNRVPVYVSLFAALLFLVSTTNAYAQPKVGHFALVVILLTLIVISFIESEFWAYITTAFGALAVMYIRPEFSVTFGLLLCALVIMVFVRNKAKISRWGWVGLGALALTTILALVLLHSPISGTRSFSAFAQHFSMNWVTWTGSNLNPWTETSIVSQNFGAASSIPQAFVSNPAAFARHINSNVLLLATYSLPQILPVTLTLDDFTKLVLFIVFAGVCVLVFGPIRDWVKRERTTAMLYGLFLLPGLISVVVIYPEPHYLVPVFGLLLAAALAAVFSLREMPSQFASIPWLAITAGIIVIATPSFVGPSLPDQRNQVNLKTIQYLNSLGLTQPVHVLDAEGFYDIYVKNLHSVREIEMTAGFSRLIADKKINMIVSSPGLMSDRILLSDPAWVDLVAGLGHNGWSIVGIPGTIDQLIIRDDLLNLSGQ